MKKTIYVLLASILYLTAYAQKREQIWHKNKMPYPQEHQIAAMTDEAGQKDFKADKHRVAYIEWFDAPQKDIHNGACMILISGGSYQNCCDVGLIKQWREKLTALGFQCVNFVYRTPRPIGLPIYQTAWADGQRAVKIIRQQARKRGFDPEKIGVISMSAGSHLALLLATSSQTPAYEHADNMDTIPCHINWAIVNAPAYGTTDAETGTPATRQGYGTDVHLSQVFKFDKRTCPMSLHHGSKDIYAPQTSTLVYRELRKRGIPAELHLYADKGHGAYGLERGVEFMRQMGYFGSLDKEVPLMERYVSDDARGAYTKTEIWPDGKTPDLQQKQCTPYMEWHMPKELKTKAIQIIYSGGGYNFNNPDDFEVAPIRRYLNEKGMTVVTLKYRTPRPMLPLSKHTTAWQDLQRTVRLVRSQAEARGLDPNRIGIMGSSAGGHLTAHYSNEYNSAAVREVFPDSKKPNFSVPCYPVISADESFAHKGSFVNLLGEYPTGEDVAKYSCDKMVTPNTPPTFIWHTAEDQAVPVKNSLVYATALADNKVPFSLRIYPYGVHGIATVDHLTNDDDKLDPKTLLAKDWFNDFKAWFDETF